MKRTIRAGIAGLLVLAVATPVAHADVTVRAEAFAGTVLPATSVPIDGSDTFANGKSCPDPTTNGRSAAGALERATAGQWDGTSFSFGLSVERIRTTDLGGFPSPTYWNFDIDNSSQLVGICDVNPSDGQEILFYEACADEQTLCFTGGVLGLTAPGGVEVGVPFTVRVDEFDDTQSPATSAPAAGATVAGGGASVTTAADGTAAVTLNQTGTVTLVATKGRLVRDAATVTAYDYSVPPGPVDAIAPVSTVESPRDGRKFERGNGPRTLRASVVEDEGLASVRLGLFRRVKDRCSAYDGEAERFRSTRCGARPRFALGTDAAVSYLLPKRLGRGKYVFDVVATDTAGNRESVERGRNKAVFRVR